MKGIKSVVEDNPRRVQSPVSSICYVIILKDSILYSSRLDKQRLCVRMCSNGARFAAGQSKISFFTREKLLSL